MKEKKFNYYKEIYIILVKKGAMKFIKRAHVQTHLQNIELYYYKIIIS
jgi:hypothetical protein